MEDLYAYIDPKTGESFPGNYKFNPFTGDALKSKAPDQPAGADTADNAAPVP